MEVPIFGMVKDDRHRTRALVTPEGREIGIVTQQAVFSLIGQIQEETHRFAITYHHESHSKSATRSALDDIPGVGPKRWAELRKHFGTIKAIREADVETLAPWCPGPPPRRCGTTSIQKRTRAKRERGKTARSEFRRAAFRPLLI